ncbi:MAG: hypothetical protein JOS17DRAFT_753373 [Linnemannia elongata]|nr:MAG: hypothetical protein JOS17DRAFT_753373 [Linnemannia elongata]
MSLPDIFGLVSRQWQQRPSLISPRATPAAHHIKDASVTLTLPATRTDNVLIRTRAEPLTTTSPRNGGPSTGPTSSSTTLPSWDTTTTPFSRRTPTSPNPTGPDQGGSTTSIPPLTTPTSSPGYSTETTDSPTSMTTTPITTMTTSTSLPPLPTNPPPNDKGGSAGPFSNGAIIGAVAAAFVMLIVLSIWFCRRQRKKGRGLFGYSRSNKLMDNEKGLHQAHRQPDDSGSPSPTHSFYGGNGYGHSDAYYYQYGNNLHNSNSISRGPQNIYPEMADVDSARSGNILPQTLPNDTAVYWPPPPGLSPQGLGSSSPPPPPFSSLATSPSAAAETAAASILLKRNATRNPQDHRRQEQLEHLLMLQRRQIRELQELQHQHQRENPLSSLSAPHAPTQADRQIWQQSDQEQRQHWLQQQQPYLPRGGRDNSGGIIVSGPIGAVRDPQDWGIYDNDGGGGGHSQRVMQERKRNSGASNEEEVEEPSDDGQQNLRQYIAQMKADYEEQFRKHQEELDRLKAEQETQLQMLRDQIKE